MSLTQRTVTIRSPMNQGVPGLYAALAAWLSSHPSIIIQDVDWFRQESTVSADGLRLRMAYLEVTAPAVGGTWAARLYRTTPTATAQALFNLDFGAGADLVPMFTRDVTNHERVINDPDSILVIGIQTIVGSVLGMVGYDRAAFIGQPNGSIAAGASGAGTLIDAGGRVVTTTAVLRNVGAVAWPAQQRNYVVMDEVTGELIGLPSCCTPSAAPTVSSTTTTPYPCPAYLAGASVPLTTAPNNPIYPPSVVSPAAADATDGDPFTYTIVGSGTGPFVYGVTNPPSWLTSIDPVTGVISGTPDVTGTIVINVTVTNAGGTTTYPVTIEIASGSDWHGTIAGCALNPYVVASDGGFCHGDLVFRLTNESIGGTLSLSKTAGWLTTTCLFKITKPDTTVIYHVNVALDQLGLYTAEPVEAFDVYAAVEGDGGSVGNSTFSATVRAEAPDDITVKSCGLLYPTQNYIDVHPYDQPFNVNKGQAIDSNAPGVITVVNPDLTQVGPGAIAYVSEVTFNFSGHNDQIPGSGWAAKFAQLGVRYIAVGGVECGGGNIGLSINPV